MLIGKFDQESNFQPRLARIGLIRAECSVILEADRSQIPIASLVDSKILLGSYKRITYPIPANDPIQGPFVSRKTP